MKRQLEPLDQINIHNLECFCRHGVYKEETALGQKFMVDVTIYVHTRKAGRSDAMEDSVSYGEICRFIQTEMTKQNDKLLERVAERISEGILIHFPIVKKIIFEIKKPWAPVMMHIDYASVKIERSWHRAYVGAGSNMGDRHKYLADAADMLAGHRTIKDFRQAAIIETEPYGYTEQAAFLNTIYEFDTLMTPEELLDVLHDLENQADRKREIHWGPRTLDLDILLYDHMITEDPDLILPHPEIEKRMFVLESLCELNPYGVHPVLQKRYITLKDELKKLQ